MMNHVTVLKALGEETRLRLLRALAKAPSNVNTLADQLSVSQYNVSKHLRILRNAGLVILEKEGREHFHTITPELHQHLSNNKGVLDLGCCTFQIDALPE